MSDRRHLIACTRSVRVSACTCENPVLEDASPYPSVEDRLVPGVPLANVLRVASELRVFVEGAFQASSGEGVQLEIERILALSRLDPRAGHVEPTRPAARRVFARVIKRPPFPSKCAPQQHERLVEALRDAADRETLDDVLLGLPQRIFAAAAEVFLNPGDRSRLPI